MLRRIADMPGGTIGFEAVDAVEDDDWEDVVEPVLRREIADGGNVRLLYLLGPGSGGVEGHAIKADAGFRGRHASSFDRLAVVSDEDWVRPRCARCQSSCPARRRASGCASSQKPRPGWRRRRIHRERDELRSARHQRTATGHRTARTSGPRRDGREQGGRASGPASPGSRPPFALLHLLGVDVARVVRDPARPYPEAPVPYRPGAAYAAGAHPAPGPSAGGEVQSPLTSRRITCSPTSPSHRLVGTGSGCSLACRGC